MAVMPARQSLTRFLHLLASLRVSSDASQSFVEFLGISHLPDEFGMVAMDS